MPGRQAGRHVGEGKGITGRLGGAVSKDLKEESERKRIRSCSNRDKSIDQAT